MKMSLHTTLCKRLVFFIYVLFYVSVFYSGLNFFVKRKYALCGFVENKNLHGRYIKKNVIKPITFFLLVLMSNDIECNRAAITLFNLCKWNHVSSYKRSCSSILEILLTNFTCTFLVASLTVLQKVNPNIDIVFLLFVLHFTFIIGNVEVNSGPLTNEISNASLINTDKSLDMCNINIRSIRNKLEFFQNIVDKFDIIT